MSLTEVSYYSRKFAPFAILIGVVILILFYSFKLLLLFGDLNRPKVIQINPIFKELRPIDFSEATRSGEHTYVMDTVEGEPVTATDTAKVFFIPKSPFRFGYKEKISLMAKNLGFDDNAMDYKLNSSKNEAIFTDKKRTFTVDITNYNFKFNQDITISPDLFVKNGVPDKDSAQNKAIDFLKSMDRYPDDFAKGKMNVIFMQYDTASSKSAVLQDNKSANMVEVDFYRADIDGQFPVVSPKYFNSPNYVIMVQVGDQGYQVVGAQVHFFEKSEGQVGIYPVIDGKTALEKLATGSGYIVSGADKATSRVSVKQMFMGYYDPDTYQDYLQPVYVFLGDNNFVGYVPAVTDRYLIDYSKL